MIHLKYMIAGTIVGLVVWCGGVGSFIHTHPRASRSSSPTRIVASASGLKGYTQVGYRPARTRTTLFDAIRQVESGGDDAAVGDDGASLGPYQIGKMYWQDAIEFGLVDWSYDDLVRSRPHCEQIMLWYWQRYGATTDEQRSRMHNGGLRGMSKQSTKAYWNRVLSNLKGA